MRIVLMGTGPFAVPSFEALRASGDHDIPLIVTRPVQNTDVKHKSVANPVRAWADEHRLTVFDPPSINDTHAIEQVACVRPDLLVVCDYGQILSSKALEAARLGGINLHGSLLPRHRGAAPVQWTLLRGDTTTGVCVIHMTPKLDGGPVISRVQTEIEPWESAGDLEKRLSQLGVNCCLDSIDKLARCAAWDDCEALGERQDLSLATTAPRLSKSDGQLDFRYSADLIHRQVRGLRPWPGAFGTIRLKPSRDAPAKEMRVSVGQVLPTGVAVDRTSKTPQSLPIGDQNEKVAPGIILWRADMLEAIGFVPIDDGTGKVQTPEMVVACRDRFLAILRIQPSGGKMLDARDFLAGYGRNESMRFAVLDDAPPQPLLEKMANSTAKV